MSRRLAIILGIGWLLTGLLVGWTLGQKAGPQPPPWGFTPDQRP